MTIKDLAEKYQLKKNDFWKQELKTKQGVVFKTLWIISHDTVEKIMHKEGIQIDEIQVLTSEKDLVRYLIHASSPDGKRVITTGEADNTNVKQVPKYLGCMAEKRGIDRAVLKLINAYEYGIYSDSENMEEVRPPRKSQKETNKADSDKLILESIIDANDIASLQRLQYDLEANKRLTKAFKVMIEEKEESLLKKQFDAE